LGFRFLPAFAWMKLWKFALLRPECGYNTYRGWTQTGYLNKHYNMNQKDEDT